MTRRRPIPCIPWWQFAIFILAIAMLTLLIACGSGSTQSNTQQPPPSGQVSVTISPTTASVVGGSNLQFRTLVLGTNNTALTWQVNGMAGGSSNVGTVSGTGLFSAPAIVPSPATVTVTAVSQADSTVSASATLTITLGLTLTPSSASLGVGSNQQFMATVNGSANQGVAWKVNGVPGGNSQLGTIDGIGLYIAPTTVPAGTVTVTAMADVDGTLTGSAAVRIASTDPSGTVTNSSVINCPPTSDNFPGGTCYSLDVQCPGVSNLMTYLKVNTPSGTPIGTVMFGTGTGGANLYEHAFVYGTTTLQNVLNAGFTTVQISFGEPFSTSTPNGWLTGPGGVRKLACRYATAAHWVYDNIHKSSTSKPLCATGNSGGAAAISYSLSEYNLSSIFSMVEPTSGPPMARVDYGCTCTQVPQPTPCGQGALSTCYEPATASGVIDPAYASPLCSNSVNTGDTSHAAQFLSDSVNAPGATYSFRTDVHVVFGGQDNSSAVPQGMQWLNNVPNSPAECVADAPHAIPDVLDGAQKIANDIINYCHVQP